MRKTLLMCTLVSAALMMPSCHMRIGEDETLFDIPQIEAKVGDKTTEARIEWGTSARLHFLEGPDWEITSSYKPEIESIIYKDPDGYISPKRITITFKEELKKRHHQWQIKFWLSKLGNWRCW